MQGLARGESIARILMNQSFATYTLRGTVVDVGGGRAPNYFDYFAKAGNTRIEAQDGTLSGIDFEKDALPYADASVDTVILANVLEHVFHHAYLLKQVHRILRPDGELIGFVPFLVGYHPDPEDYFRYTKPALERLLSEAGFASCTVAEVGGSPLMANLNTLMLSFPKSLRPLLYLWYRLWDRLFLVLRPTSRLRTPLGFTFSAHA